MDIATEVAPKQMNLFYAGKKFYEKDVWIFFTLTLAWTWTLWGMRALILNARAGKPIRHQCRFFLNSK
jgi:hypothetical protein